MDMRVVMAAGAKVLGPITIGDDASIGATAVVVKPVPSGTVVAGAPGRGLVDLEGRFPGLLGTVLRAAGRDAVRAPAGNPRTGQDAFMASSALERSQLDS